MAVRTRLTCILGLLAAIAVGSASGAYVFPYTVDSSVSYSADYNPSEDSEETVTVSLSYHLLVEWSVEEKQGDYQISGGTLGYGHEDVYNAFFSDLNDWLGSNNDAPELGADIAAGTYTYTGDNGTATVVVSERIYTEKPLFVTKYYGHATISFRGTSVPTYDDLTDLPRKELVLPKGSLLPVDDLAQGGRLELVDLSSKYPGREWSIIGFYSNGQAFDVSEPIEGHRSFTVELAFNDASTTFASPLGTRISELTSGTHAFYVNAVETSRNIAADPSFNSDLKTVSLGKDGGVSIGSGVTVNFALVDGSLTKTNQVALKTVEPNRASNLSFAIVLASDLTIRGTMAIGSSYGSDNAGRIQSAIGGEYVALDLNGHDITIEGSGRLDSYGLIYDSKGTGTIRVVGGTLSTLAVITDYKGGSHTLAMQKNTVFPFTSFSFPYLRAETSVEYGSEWGKVIANCNVCLLNQDSLGSLGGMVDPFTDFVLNFIGPSSSSTPYFFQLQGSGASKSSIVLEAVRDEEMSASLYGIEYRLALEMNDVQVLLYKFEFNMSITIDMGLFDIPINVDIDTSDYVFPIPGYFDIRMNSSSLVIKQAIEFMAGATLLSDRDSYIFLSYLDSDTAADIAVLDRGVNYYDLSRRAAVTNDFTKSASVVLDPSTQSSNFLSRYSMPHIKVDGTIVFRTGNSKAYRLAGPLDFAKVATTSSSEDFPSEDSITVVSGASGANPFVAVNEAGALVETFGFSAYPGWTNTSASDIVLNSKPSELTLTHYKGYARPLVSHGVAYYTAAGPLPVSHVGTYSFETGTFLCPEGTGGSNRIYFFDCEGSFQPVDTQSCILREATAYANNVFTAEDGSTYLYFASMYFRATPVAGRDGYYTFTRSRLTNYDASTAVTVHYDAASGRFVR